MIGLYRYETNKTGDDFRSHVLSQYLGGEGGCVWRDGVSNYAGPVTILMVNGFATAAALSIPDFLIPIFLFA